MSVNLDVDKEGVYHPRFIRWENGRIFQIEKLTYKCRASSKEVGGGGIRYTVMICGKETFLFHEGDKWFVEAREGSANRPRQQLFLPPLRWQSPGGSHAWCRPRSP